MISHFSEHVLLFFLPAYSPELQPAEHLWPLANTALANRHFTTIDELEDAQARAVWRSRHAPISSAQPPRFHWWPQRIRRIRRIRRIKKRQHPRRN